MNVSCWWLVLSVSSCLFSLNYYNKNKLAAATLLYTLLSAISVMAVNKYAHAPESIHVVLMSTSLWGLLSVFSVVFISEWIYKKEIINIENTFCVATFLNACLVIFNAIFFPVSIGNHGYTGFLLNASMNGCLIALGAGIAINKKMWGGLLLITLAVTLSLSSVPIGVLCVVVGAYLICHFRGKEALKYIGATAVLTLICGAISSGKHLFDSAGRFEAYRIFMTEWLTRKMYFFGTGLGTFQAMSPQMQAKHGFMMEQTGYGHWWSSMHSDWLQCLFELGIFGLILYGCLFYKTLKTFYAREEHVLFSVMSGIGAIALFNYPFRYSVFGVIAVYVVFRASDLKSKRAWHEDFAG